MKIDEIVINNYRAFCNEKGEENTRYIIKPKGKNLLIYGENGSGKSSLFKGFRDFFISASDKDLEFQKNIFSEDFALDEQPFIKISFNDGANTSHYYYSSEFTRINTGTDFLRGITKSRSFMSYRELMKIHFIDQGKVNLFAFLIGENGLLSEIVNPVSTVTETKISLGELWKNICQSPDETAISDFNNGLKLHLDELTGYLNVLLLYFDDKLKVDFDFAPITKENVTEGEGYIGLKVIYCEKNIKQYHLFLNEARLTAMAISIYLAAHLTVPKGEYEILFLDDVFTGLDTSNRVPLLKILSTPQLTDKIGDTFLSHQVFLTTYDRQWFDLARQHLGSNWDSIEFYVGELSGTIIRPVLIDPAMDYVQKALSHFDKKDYPACANYQRRECEKLIKNFLPGNYKFTLDSDNNIIPVNKLGQLFDKLQGYCKENSLDIKVLDEFRNYSKVVLNPLSHDDLESPAYKRELEEVFKIMEELKTLKNVLKLKAGTVLKFEKEHGKTKTKYHYEFEVRTDVRLISLGMNTATTPLTVLPIKIKKMGKQGDRIALFSRKLLERVSKILKLSKKPTELDIRSAPLNKMHEVVLKFLQVDKTLEAIDEFYVEKKDGSRKILREILSENI